MQVGNKISRWKGIHRHKYEALKLSFAEELRAEQLQLLPQQQQQPQPQPQPQLQPQQPPDLIRSSNSNRVRPSPPRTPLVPHYSGTGFPFSPPRPSPARAIPSPARAIPSPTTRIRPFSPLPGGMNATLHALAARADTLTANLEMVERNSPFLIYHFENHLVCIKFENHELPSGRVPTGFIIELQDQDLRYLLTKFTGSEVPSFEAFAIGEHEVLVKKPSVSFTFLCDEAAEQKGLSEAGVLDKMFTQPIGVARNAIIRDTDRHFETYRLTFPFPLDNDVLCPNAENWAIKPTVIPVILQYDVETKNGPATLTSHRVTIQWKISQNENILRSTKQSKKTNELDQQATTIFSNLDRMGMLSLNPRTTNVLPPSTSAAIVVSGAAHVALTSSTTAKRSAQDATKDSKRPAISAAAAAPAPAPASVPSFVAIHPLTKAELNEDQATQLVNEFALAQRCSSDDAFKMLQNQGAKDWQAAVDLLVLRPGDVAAASAATASHTTSKIKGKKDEAESDCEPDGGFKSKVDLQAARDGRAELQKSKRESRRKKKQAKMRQIEADTEMAEEETMAEEEKNGTETIEFDNTETPPSDATLTRHRPFLYGPYRDKSNDSDSDSMGSLGPV